MHILVTGSTGFIGSALVPFLTNEGHGVTRLIRTQPMSESRQVHWDPAAGTIDAAGVVGTEAVVHLAAESIAAGRWTAKQKARIRDSRVMGTRLLVDTLVGLDPAPKVVACASSDVYYGDRGDEILREDSPAGSNFLAEVTREWEAETRPLAEKGIRVVNLRFGMVIGPPVATMLTRFKLGLGSRLGSGKQYISWVTLNDAVRAIHHALTTDNLEGPLNVVAPGPVTNGEFCKTLNRVLSRRALFPVPALALRVAQGEMADIELVSLRMESQKLAASGFVFLYPEVEGALKAVLGKS